VVRGVRSGAKKVGLYPDILFQLITIILTYLVSLFIIQFTDTKKQNQVKFKCDTRSDDTSTKVRDSIAYNVQSTDSGVQVGVAYSHETSSNTTASSTTATQYDLHFDRVIEYRKNLNGSTTIQSNEDEAYNWNTDTVVQEVSLSSMQDFSNIQDNNTTSTFSVASQDNTSTFQFTISRAAVGQTVTANSIKIDFIMQNFPWLANNSYVALLCTVRSIQGVSIVANTTTVRDLTGGSNDTTSGAAPTAPALPTHPQDVVIPFDQALQDTGVTPFGQYTWAKEATVNSNTTTVQVVATSPPSDTTQMAFSFVGSGASGASDLYWDPQAGVGYASGASTRSGLVVAMALMSSAATAMAVIVY
jgi:hypothetical protein